MATADTLTRFEVRLESQTDEHYRITRLQAHDADEAQALCERTEYAICAYQMPADTLDEAELIDASPDEVLKGTLKGQLFAHRQTKPYRVVSVTEIEG